MLNIFFLVITVISVPVAVIGGFMDWPALLMFIIDSVAVIGLAFYIGKATENLAVVTGPSIGGLLNASFGNAAEIIIAVFALSEGLTQVVLASLTGSVLGNLLLVGGLSFFVGGLRAKRHQLNVHEARHNAGLLLFAIVIAFVFPYIFSSRVEDNDTQIMSIIISIVLIIIYLAGLFFKLVTHRGVFKSSSPKENEKSEAEEEPDWNLWMAIGVLVASTAAVAYISEDLVHRIEPVGASLGWSDLFIGVIIVAIVGNAAEHSSAVMMAYQKRMNVAVEIAVGSSLQIAMFGAPILVLISLLLGDFMPLVFSSTELISMVLSALLVINLTSDGDTNWFEGAMMLGAYIIMGVGFYLL
nr:calcium/proton exchanger [Tuberibacillus sp. Marseille-P3662]